MTNHTRQEIEKFYIKQAEIIAEEFWGVEMTCPIEFVNRKWKRLNAKFSIHYDTGEHWITLNHKVHEEIGVNEYLRTLKHEMVHWYLWSIGEPHSDGDAEFVRECIRIGASISNTQKAKKAYKEVVAEMRSIRSDEG